MVAAQNGIRGSGHLAAGWAEYRLIQYLRTPATCRNETVPRLSRWLAASPDRGGAHAQPCRAPALRLAVLGRGFGRVQVVRPVHRGTWGLHRPVSRGLLPGPGLDGGIDSAAL